MYWHFIASLSRRLQLDVRPISDKPQVRVGTSGQSISTKRRIAPALVTPAAGESILKPRFRRDALSPSGQVCSPALLRRLLLNTLQCIQRWGTTLELPLLLGGGSVHPL